MTKREAILWILLTVCVMTVGILAYAVIPPQYNEGVPTEWNTEP